MIKVEIFENGLIADLFTDPSPQPRKALMMLGGSEGGKSWSRIKKPVEILVQRGYAVLSLAYFKEKGLPDSLEDIPIEYFEGAFSWLSNQEGIIPDEVAILGGSKGAEAGLLLGSLFPQVKAVIALSPSHVVWQGIPKKQFGLGKNSCSSWSHYGESLPYLPYPPVIKKSDILLLRLRQAHEEALMNSIQEKDAVIPVENINGAIMLISGNRDHIWPATLMGEKIMDRLTTQEFMHHFEHTEFKTGHNGLIMNKTCWRNIFDFLKIHYS